MAKWVWFIEVFPAAFWWCRAGYFNLGQRVLGGLKINMGEVLNWV